jgi:hypothetical protein
MTSHSTKGAAFYQRTVKEIDDIEQPATEYAESRGWFIEKVVSNSRRGFPDRFCARKGRVMLLEFKKPGGEPTAQQLKRHKELRDQGVEVYLVDNLTRAKELLK